MAVTNETRRWTYEDLYSLPDDKRYEIIDGELYEMPGANSDHAISIANILALLFPMVRNIAGRVLTAPLDVFLPDANPVQPDILVLLPDQLHLISRRGIEGAPALLVEVLSPSNPAHDRVRKRALYARAGVREYGIVSPEAAIVEVLALDGEAYRLHVRAGGDETVTSTLFPDLSVPASALFA